MSCSLDRCFIMASVVTLLRKVLAKSAAAFAGCGLPDERQPVTHKRTRAKASAANLDIELTERRKRNVANHKPNEDHRERNHRRPALVLPAGNSSPPQAAV